MPEILTHRSNPENDSNLPEQIAVSRQQPIRSHDMVGESNYQPDTGN